MEIISRDELNRVIKKVSESEFSKITTTYSYVDEDREPDYISTIWEDYSHKVYQEHEEVFEKINGKNLIVSERISYFNDKDDLLDYHNSEYFYNSEGEIVMITEQDNEDYSTTVNGIRVTSKMGERICEVEKLCGC